MKPDRSTRRLIDLQVLLGVATLCLAERSAGLAVLSVAVYAALWLGRRLGPRPPLPLSGRVANLGALVAVGAMLVEASRPGAELVVAMGHFTVMLQGLLLAGRRSGRDDAMLLVLGLIQVLAASVLSTTVFDGILLLVWCVVGAAALTRLSMRSARQRVLSRNASLGGPPAGASAAPGLFPPQAAPPIGRVFLVGVVLATITAAAVFVATPRREAGTRADAATTAGALRGTGFATRVDLGSGAPQRVLGGPVLHVTLRQGGGNIGRDGRDFLLRGAALDRYEPDTRSWGRSAALTREDVLIRLDPESDGRMSFAAGTASQTAPGTRWEIEAVQRGGAIGTLFLPTDRMMAAGTPLSLEIAGLRSLGFNPIDRRLQAVDRVGPDANTYRATVAPLRDEGLAAAYRRLRPVRSLWAHEPEPARGEEHLQAEATGGDRWPAWLRPWRRLSRSRGPSRLPPPANPAAEALLWEVEPERVAKLAQHVLAAAGLGRDPEALPGPEDRRRVERLEHYLRTNFAYTLDNPPVAEGNDPVLEFLFENRSGHCELFAAGLVAMCRSVGIPARIATGYRAGEFNELGRYYVVRAEHAHAWAEVALGVPAEAEPGEPALAGPAFAGWTTFDATPPAEVRAEHERSGPGWLRGVRHAFEHAEYTWVSRVVAFGPETRERAFRAIRSAAVTLLSDRLGWTRWIPAGPRWRVGVSFIAVGISLVACGVGLWVLHRRRDTRRRVALRPAAFGVAAGGVPVRRLGFYARLLDVLGRQGFERPPAATPAAWAAGLAASDPDRFAGVPEVTDAFYRARFGNDPPDADEVRRIDATLYRLAASGSGEPRG